MEKEQGGPWENGPGADEAPGYGKLGVGGAGTSKVPSRYREDIGTQSKTGLV